jgi:hypothetical protein
VPSIEQDARWYAGDVLDKFDDGRQCPCGCESLGSTLWGVIERELAEAFLAGYEHAKNEAAPT